MAKMVLMALPARTAEIGTDGKDSDAMFKEIRQDENFVYFVLIDGTELVVPKAASLDITFDTEDLVVMVPNSSRDIHYTISSTSIVHEVICKKLGDKAKSLGIDPLLAVARYKHDSQNFKAKSYKQTHIQ